MSGPSKITGRIVSECGIPRLFSVLAAELAASDLQSLLLEVFRARVADRRDSEILDRAVHASLFAPSGVDARLMNAFDLIAFQAAAAFEAIELSPLCPLGAEAVLGGIDQNNVLSALRGAEVLGDPTTAMAVEVARRRKEVASRTASPVRLCCSHRVIRLQPFDRPGFSPHFRLFALVSGGRDRGSRGFETEELGEHIRFYLELFRGLNAGGFCFERPLVEISDLDGIERQLMAHGVTCQEIRETVRAHRPEASKELLAARGIELASAESDPAIERVFEPLRRDFPEAEYRVNPTRLEGLGYYSGWCLRISPAAPDGVRYAIADGGFTTWTARLLQDKKERLLTSGIGVEFACRKFAIGAGPPHPGSTSDLPAGKT